MSSPAQTLYCAGFSRVKAPQTVLLYGPPGSGKSLLSNAIAHQAGATVFDLSPAVTDGKYPGKQAALMVHMVRRCCGLPGVGFVFQVKGWRHWQLSVAAPPSGDLCYSAVQHQIAFYSVAAVCSL